VGAVALRLEGLEGDEQADLKAHGGPDKAVCCYPAEHIPSWERAIGAPLPAGAFGENLRVSGVREDQVCLGDVFTIGTGVVQISQPRGPCFKLAARWGLRDLPARMAQAGISGWYVRVLQPGTIQAGDGLRLQQRTSEISIAEVMRVTYRDRRDTQAIEAVLAASSLAPAWQATLHKLARHPQQEPNFGG